MIWLLAVLIVGVALQVPRLRAHYARRSPIEHWDHFLVETGLRPVPATMPDVVAVAAKADIPPAMLDRVALGRTPDKCLAMVAQLTNGRVLVGVRRDGPTGARAHLVLADGWQLQVTSGPAARAWRDSPLRTPRNAHRVP